MFSLTALLTALALAEEHGGASAAVRVTGRHADLLEGLDGLQDGIAARLAGLEREAAVEEALALGFLAGRIADRPRDRRMLDITSFLIDHDLVVRGAEGRSMLRLPWFEEDLFVSRQLPDIREIPRDVRRPAVVSYRAGLRGERSQFTIDSHGLRYTVDTIPVLDAGGRVVAALGLARPVAGVGVLTAREREVLQLAADGLSGPEIARRLVLSTGTVKTHFQNIYAKWGVDDRAGAVARGLRSGVID